MSDIRVDHNGYEIHYAENEDVWRCWRMDLQAKSLSALKTKINQADAAARRVGNVPAFIVEEYSSTVTAVFVTLLDDDEHAWVIPREPGKKVNARSRQKVKIEKLVPDTPETAAAMGVLTGAYEAVRDAHKAANAARASLPRMTLAGLGKTPKGKGGEPIE